MPVVHAKRRRLLRRNEIALRYILHVNVLRCLFTVNNAFPRGKLFAFSNPVRDFDVMASVLLLKSFTFVIFLISHHVLCPLIIRVAKFSE